MGARAASAVKGARAARIAWLLVALLALAVPCAARTLEPHPQGLGTHVALGLPPCAFLDWLELPCPTCGMTTAFALLARGELLRSLQAHPLGLPLFAATLLMPLLSLRYALRGEPLLAVIDRYRLDRIALVFALLLLVTWTARVAPLLTR